MDGVVACPVCNRDFNKDQIEDHVNKCLFLNTKPEKSSSKRMGSFLNNVSPREKRLKAENNLSNTTTNLSDAQSSNPISSSNPKVESIGKSIPLAEQMRPLSLEDIVGHKESFGAGTMLRSMLDQNKIPNMILWGPPGCGKTSMANVIAQICKKQKNMRFVKMSATMAGINDVKETSMANVIAQICKKQKNMRFVKMSATMAGINDVKEVVKVAKNEAQFKRQTVLFMDEIHRFNKLQQDSFLPHVENGTIVLIGATTENPSFSLNNALLSRCKVIVMEKLSVEDVLLILHKAVEKNENVDFVDSRNNFECAADGNIPKCLVEHESLRWVAEVCDGDARVALGALELALTACAPGSAHGWAPGSAQAHDCAPGSAHDSAPGSAHGTGPALLTLEHIKQGIKRSHMVYDHHGEQHYNTISALHKSIRAGDDNAALYWATRALHGGEDPLYIARRLVRIACEDVGLADQNAIVEAVACLQGCQQLGMPESDVLLAQCAVRLARAPKARQLHDAMKRCQRSLTEAKGPLPPVPLHLRNASTKLMKQLGYGQGYNLNHKDESGLVYMPEGMENVDFFEDDNDCGA